MIALLDTITLWTGIAGFCLGAAVGIVVGILIGWTQKTALDDAPTANAKAKSDALADLALGNQGLKVVRMTPASTRKGTP